MSLAHSAITETEDTFNSQLDQLERRNNLHAKFSQVKDRTKAIGVCIQRCRQLIIIDEGSAALLYIKCLSMVEETDLILSGGRNSAMSNTTSQISSLNRIQPIEMQTFQVINNASIDRRKSNGWTRNSIITDPVQIVNGEEDQAYYGNYKSKWWRILCMNSAKEAKEKDSDVRDLWNTQIEFFLSCLGFIVGVGNILRFPSMMYQYGGVFFIPYLISMFIFGLPLVYMHLCIGQYSGLSASGAFWKMMPVASGIGWALVLLALPVSIYYNVIVAWAVYYLWYSIQGIFLPDGLPWSYCQDDWIKNYHCCPLPRVSTSAHNFTQCYSDSQALTAPESFFHYQVLNRTVNADNFEFGDIQMHIVLSLAVAWILVFFGVFKGIGSIASAVSITATVPYFLLIVLLLRALSLPGANRGIMQLLRLDFQKLWNINIWRSAAEQVFYELGIDAGPLISMASFSRYRNNIYRDAVLLVLLDLLTSILCCLVIFAFMGFMGFLAGAEDTEIKGILKHEPLYLAFTVYPGVTSLMDWGFLWAASFFAMLTLSALDAQFAWLEMIASAILNQIGTKNKSVETRFLVCLCFFCFVCGIPLCARGGIFIFHAIENLNANWNSFSISLMQVIVVCFIYGVDKFLEDIGEMLRVEKPPQRWSVPGKSRWQVVYKRLKHFFGPTGGYIKFSWCVFSPFILMTLFIASLVNNKRVKFNDHILPLKYEAVAWIVMVGPLFVVPFTVIYTIYEAWKHNKPLLSVFSGKNWRNKKLEQEQQHRIDSESDYMYIDAISRGASAKSRVKEPVIDHEPTNEDNYSRANDRIRQWAVQSSQNEPLRSFDVPSIITSTDYEAGKNYEEEELYGRRTGRIRDMLNEENQSKSFKISSSSSSSDEDQRSGRRQTVKKSPFSKSAAVSSINDPPLNLFGPPPAKQRADVFAQSMTRIKNRDQRRSDQKRNRIFTSSFNLVVMEEPAESNASNSGDRMPSPAIPDRPEINGHHKIESRKSVESGTNVSLLPYNIDPSNSTGSTPTDNTEPFAVPFSIPKLKRPKPIGIIPPDESPSRD